MNRKYESHGARLSYYESGAGVPLVFLHPTPLDHDYWRPMIADLPTDRIGIRAIVPDLRGHGQSELGEDLPVGGFSRVPDAPVLTVELLATDILMLLDRLNVYEAIFVGCSIGGYVMLELARRAPEKMKAMAFVCSKPQPDAEANLAKRAANIAQVRSEGTWTFFDSMALTLIGATARAKHPAILTELRARMKVSAEGIVAVQAGLAVRPDSVPTVSRIGVPVLAICGGEDPGVTQAEMSVFKNAPGGCTFHLLPDAGHFAAYEQPEKVAAMVAEWLRTLKF
jgi:pimeloyl-ACP methyl ester carboxylesterase